MTSQLLYENRSTGECTYIHKQAVQWFSEGAEIWLYRNEEIVCIWEH